LTTDGFVGVTAIDTSTAGVTVSVVEPLTLPEVAWIVVLPADTLVAIPAAEIVATPVLLELQVTDPVMFNVLLSLYVPVAVNCCVPPFAIEGFAGVTAIDTSTAVTVNGVDPLILPSVAWIVVLPVNTPLARPVALIVATDVLLDPQVTELVRFCVLLSLYVPVAVNCCVEPFAKVEFAGVTAIDTNVAGVTVKVVDPNTLPELA